MINSQSQSKIPRVIRFLPFVNVNSPINGRRKNDHHSLSEESEKNQSLYEEILNQVELYNGKSNKEFVPHLNRVKSTIDTLINNNTLFASQSDNEANKPKLIKFKSFKSYKSLSPIKIEHHESNLSSFFNHAILSKQLSVDSITQSSLPKIITTSKGNNSNLIVKTKQINNPIHKRLILKRKTNEPIVHLSTIINANSNLNQNHDQSKDDNLTIQKQNNTSEMSQNNEEINLPSIDSQKQLSIVKPYSFQNKRANKLKTLVNPNFLIKQIYEKCAKNLDLNCSLINNTNLTTHIPTIGKDSNSVSQEKINMKLQQQQYNSYSKLNTDTMKILQEANPWDKNNKQIDNVLDNMTRLNVKSILHNQKVLSKKINLNNKNKPNGENKEGGYMFNNEASISQNGQYDKQRKQIKLIRNKNKKRLLPHPVENILDKTIKAKQSLVKRLNNNFFNHKQLKQNKCLEGDFYYEVNPYFSTPKYSNGKVVKQREKQYSN